MKTRNNIVRLTTLLAGLSGLASSAAADTITGSYSYDHLKKINLTSGVYNGDVNTVKFNWSRSDVPGAGVDATIGTNFSSYCVDLPQTILGGTFTFDVWTPVQAGYSSDQTTYLSRLWGEFFPSTTGSTNSAAFQLAVWEIVYDNDLNAGTGSFKSNSPSSVVNLANTWLGAISAANFAPSGTLPSLAILHSASSQDQLTALPAVPAPGAGLIGLAGLGLFASRRRR